tara:strand:+ start:501 stop:1106 length:606 start_codon:yes stop_codon:yes gene_type:complete
MFIDPSYDFWINDPSLLFDHTQRLSEPIERLNVVLTIAITVSIVLSLVLNHARFLLIAIITAIVTIVIFKKETENWTNVNGACVKSTPNNPFMNPNVIVDVPEGIADVPACYDDQDIDKNFDMNTFKDVHDLYDRGLSRRQFYTVPGSTIPNDQEGLGMWLYNTNNNKKSCKEGNMSRCAQNINLDRGDMMYVGQQSSSQP